MKFKTALILASAITALNVLVSSGFSIAGVINPASILPAGVAVSDSSQILALYAAARTLSVAIFALAAIFLRFHRMLAIFGFLAAIIQFADMWIGIWQGDLVRSVLPLVLGSLQLYGSWVLHTALRPTAGQGGRGE